MNQSIKKYLPIYALIAIILYLGLNLAGQGKVASSITLVLLLLGSLPLVWGIAVDIYGRQFGVDIIAIVAIIASVILGQYLTGVVILFMLSGGEALEAYAFRRAKKELTALLAHAPVVAHLRKDNKVIDIKVEEAQPGDILVIKPGEVIPVDGNVVFGQSMLDESAITGESLPVRVSVASQVLSGTVNTSELLEIRVSKESKDSKYEQLIRLVRQAEQVKAPIVRLADRYTVIFTIVTFAFALLAWLLSRDPVRVLAVLVVATPCPLILATPIAIISGISKSAKRGIIVKDGGVLEQLGEAKAFVFDKTGTITLGSPKVTSVQAFGQTENETLVLAASLDQLSTHILARSLLKYVKEKSLELRYPTNYAEWFGEGVSGSLDRKYFFGRLSFIEKQGVAIPAEVRVEHEKQQLAGIITVYLSDERKLLGAVYFADVIRPESANVFEKIRERGIKKILMLTGDRTEIAKKISRQIGVEEVYAEYMPEQKLEMVRKLKSEGWTPLVMVGDGVNDAAALTAADIGIAMGAHGSSASSEASGIVIAVDDLQKVEQAYAIAKQTLRIAIQGIFVGMGLSIGLMVLASLGFIRPVFGAVMQEVIDVIVIFNALRVLL